MKLGVSIGKQTDKEVEYDRAICCLCSARYLHDKYADAKLQEHLRYEHSRVMISKDESKSRTGQVTITYSGPRWANDMDVGGRWC